jgi:hypothetical protein
MCEVRLDSPPGEHGGDQMPTPNVASPGSVLNFQRGSESESSYLLLGVVLAEIEKKNAVAKAFRERINRDKPAYSGLFNHNSFSDRTFRPPPSRLMAESRRIRPNPSESHRIKPNPSGWMIMGGRPQTRTKMNCPRKSAKICEKRMLDSEKNPVPSCHPVKIRPKSNRIKPNQTESNRIQANPSESKRIQANPSESK